jgi:geranylgeranyl pyrophosphate synthase
MVSPRELRSLQRALAWLLAPSAGVEPHLAGALDDVAVTGGGLVRAQLAWAVSRGQGLPAAAALRLAAAVEGFHTASLVFDDLPAMDDASERRGRPCPHLVWGEGPAILAGLALVTRSYALLWEALAHATPRARQRAGALVARCLGDRGILDGQSRDLHFAGGERRALRAAAGKTVPLLRLALRLPLEVAGRTGGLLAADRLAASWGLAYQLLDDLKDALPSREVGKTTGRDAALGRPNLAHVAGVPATRRRLARLLARSRRAVAELAAQPGEWGCLARLQALIEADARRLIDRPASA